MRRTLMPAALAAALLMGRVAAGQAPAPQAPSPQASAPEAPAAPAPGSPGTYKSAAELLDALGRATPAGFGMTTSPVSNTDQYRVNIVHRPKAASAIAHPGNTELHYIIEGAGTIVTGGTLVRPPVPNADATIANGVSRHVTKGDVIIIPANTPHWHQAVEGSITYLEVRFVAPVK